MIIAIKAQVIDSSVIIPSKLGAKDIVVLHKDSAILQVNAAMQNPIPASHSPFETYIITQEQIKQLGCNTLIDVLRLIPSIRISKIGSAVEGELFMANGARGNSNFQFLINDVPIRPYTAMGMSLGSNLPIKQAERIEVVIGSMSTLYGTQASAGVINIILKESERPIYTSSDLCFGSEKYSNIDVNFGGKVGKGRHVVRFNAYGGFSSMNNLRVYNDADNMAIKNYFPSNRSDTLKLFRIFNDSTDFEEFKMPSYTRHIGLDIKSKYLTLAYRDLLRRDHSSMGLNPRAVGYRNLGTTFEDNISNLSLTFKKQGKRALNKISLEFINYRIIRQSKVDYNIPQISFLLMDFKDSLQLKNYSQKIVRQVDTFNQIRLRNIFNNGLERSTRFNYTNHGRIFKSFYYNFGLLLYIPLKIEQIDFFANAIDRGANNEFYKPIAVKRGGSGYVILNTGFSYKKKHTLIDYQQSHFVELIGAGINRRLSFSQNLPINARKWVLFGHLAKNYNNPNQRYINTNHTVAVLKNLTNNDTIVGFAVDTKEKGLVSLFNRTTHIEQTSWGIGLRNHNFSAYYYRQQTSDMFFYDRTTTLVTDTNFIYSDNLTPIYELNRGFKKYVNTYQKLNKILFTYDLRNNLLEINQNQIYFDLRGGYAFQWGREMTPWGKIGVLRQVPKHTITYIVSLRFKDKFSFSIVGNYYSSFYPSYTTTQNIDQVKRGNYLSNDLILNYNFSDNLQVRAAGYNILNRFNAGIEATETPDDLRLNAQQSRIFQVALIYNLDKQK